MTIDATTDRAIVINLRNLQKLPKLLADTPARTIGIPSPMFPFFSVFLRYKYANTAYRGQRQDQSSCRVTERFLWWSVYSTVAPLTLQQFRDVVFQFLQNVLGVKEQRARWKDCTENANANFGMALSYVYAEKYLDEQIRQKVWAQR